MSKIRKSQNIKMALYVNIKKLTKLNVLFKDIFVDGKTINKRSDYHKIRHNS